MIADIQEQISLLISMKQIDEEVLYLPRHSPFSLVCPVNSQITRHKKEAPYMLKVPVELR